MKRIYYGSVTLERVDGDTANITTAAMLCFAASENEAKGWATTAAMRGNPGHRVATVQMFPVPDEYVREAVAALAPDRVPHE